MENRSTHYGDVSKWIEKVIDSCETYQQTFTASSLVTNFRKQLMKNIPDKYWNAYRYELIWPLENKIITKRQEIQGKYFK
jgi:hypothetical protein